MDPRNVVSKQNVEIIGKNDLFFFFGYNMVVYLKCFHCNLVKDEPSNVVLKQNVQIIGKIDKFCLDT